MWWKQKTIEHEEVEHAEVVVVVMCLRSAFLYLQLILHLFFLQVLIQ
jgi:hypothetical protein